MSANEEAVGVLDPPATDQGHTLNDLDCATRERQRKRFATAQARAALAGITLHKLDGDYGVPMFIASQGPWTRQLDDLDAVNDWLDRVAGKVGA